MRICHAVHVCIFSSLVHARGRSGGSSGGGGGGGGGGCSDPLIYCKTECSTSGWFSNMEYNKTAGGVLLDDADYGFWTYDNKGYPDTAETADVLSMNAYRNSTTESDITDISWLMDIYDAYYNGSVIMTLAPDPNNATTASCATFTSHMIEDAYLRIGPKTRNGTNRGIYDSNDFYLALGRSFQEDKCPVTPNKLFFAVESSSSLTYSGQTWTLNATKSSNGAGFDIQGSVQSRKATYNNYYNYNVNVTDLGYVNRSTSPDVPAARKNVFHVEALTSLYSPTLSGTVTAETGKVTWTLIDYLNGYKVTAVFEGTAWVDGARLDTSGQSIVTTGEAKRIMPKIEEGWLSRNLKWIILGVALAVALAVGFCIFKCWRCVRRRKQKKEASKVIQQEPAWQRY